MHWILDDTKELWAVNFVKCDNSTVVKFKDVNVYTSLLLLCMFEHSHNLKRTFSERIQEKLKSASSDNPSKEFCCKKRAKKYWRLETDGKVGQKKQNFFKWEK